MSIREKKATTHTYPTGNENLEKFYKHRPPNSLNETCKHIGREGSHYEFNVKQEHTFGEKWCSAISLSSVWISQMADV